MIIQIEVSTHCQFNCFYCAGRKMPQQHMDMMTFDSIIKKCPSNTNSAILQGEGEPFLNKNIWQMCLQLQEKGITPYTITNGGFSFTDTFVNKIKSHFPRIGISIDTIDKNLSEKIGRFKLEKILKTLQKLLTAYKPHEIDVFTVALTKTNVIEVKKYLSQFGNIKHISQGLQPKDDYMKLYPFKKGKITYTYNCKYINNNSMRFYNVTGIEMPCCYIKDTSKYKSIENINKILNQQCIPDCCIGCREIIVPSPLH